MTDVPSALDHDATSETPAPAINKPPRRWLGRRGGWIVFGAFVIPWLYFVLVCVLTLHYISELPLILILGGFAVAAPFVYTMCYRLNPADGITPQFLVLVFLIGGFAAWIVPTAIGPIWGTITGGPTATPPISYHAVWGTIEELCKILVVIFIARWVPVKSARTGLFIGGAVGFGFAAFENLEYALTAFNNGGANFIDPLRFGYGQAVSTLAQDVVIRDVLGPFGHPLWTALLAAAVFAAYRNGRFRLTWPVVITFVAVAAVHTLWDVLPAVFGLIFEYSIGSVILGYLVYVVFGVTGGVVWGSTARRAKRASLAGIVQPEPIVQPQPTI